MCHINDASTEISKYASQQSYDYASVVHETGTIYFSCLTEEDLQGKGTIYFSEPESPKVRLFGFCWYHAGTLMGSPLSLWFAYCDECTVTVFIRSINNFLR